MEYRKNYDYIGVIELDNGDYYHVVKYATENGFYLDAGTATNACFLSSYRIECDNDDNIDECYIGKVGVFDEDNEPVTIDWRSPIASPN